MLNNGKGCIRISTLDQEHGNQKAEKTTKEKSNSIAKMKGLFKDFRKIGVGSTSIVYSIKDDRNPGIDYAIIGNNEDNPQFALKCIKKSFPNAKQLFTNEINILKKLNGINSTTTAINSSKTIVEAAVHPNILKIFEKLEDPLYFCIKTELLCGPELFNAIAQYYQNHKAKPYENSYLTECAKQLLNTIDYMHNVHQIAHRDIKPSNIKFRHKKSCIFEDLNFELVFIDFAFSKEIELEEIYENREYVGSLNYIAPEVLLEKHLSGKQILSSDIYSLGCLLYVFMTGRLPIGGSTTDEIKRNIRKGRIRWNIPHCREDAIDLLKKMITKSCDKRVNVKQALAHPWLSTEDCCRSSSFSSN